MTNRFGVDVDYCKNYLDILLRDMDNYTPQELSRALTRLALVNDLEAAEHVVDNEWRIFTCKEENNEQL